LATLLTLAPSLLVTTLPSPLVLAAALVLILVGSLRFLASGLLSGPLRLALRVLGGTAAAAIAGSP